MTNENKLLVSACLLGEPVRYDGQSKPLSQLDWLMRLREKQQLFVVCPEMAGGLGVPRAQAEQHGEKVITIDGADVSKAFELGAKTALSMCQQHNIGYALLKARSPSCGNQQIYDGSFSGTLVSGMGVTAKLLSEHGIEVFSELQLEQLRSFF